ncbi:MAG: hypothetical protein MR401_05090, partial [Bacteroidales bacterium]|nr:hypothetical protein [Bacteroidales bacterium]
MKADGTRFLKSMCKGNIRMTFQNVCLDDKLVAKLRNSDKLECLGKKVKETKRQRDKETKSQRVKESKRQRDKETKSQKVKETKRQRVKESKSQKDKESKRQKDKETKSQRDKETKRRGRFDDNGDNERQLFRVAYAPRTGVFLRTMGAKGRRRSQRVKESKRQRDKETGAVAF